MLIFPILVKQMAGSTTAVGWMYALRRPSPGPALPLARFGERHFKLENRLMAGCC